VAASVCGSTTLVRALCTVYDVDIQSECMTYEGNVQSNRRFWRDTLKNIPRIEINIDDGRLPH